LATWRITSLLVSEEGPFYILERLRYIIGIRYDESSERYGKHELARAFLCVWCLSIWVGIALAVAYLIASKATILISFPFALSAAAIVIERLANGTR